MEKDIETLMGLKKLKKPEIKVGDKYGYWKVIDPDTYAMFKGRKLKRCLCECACGYVGLVPPRGLLLGKSKSCGCRRREHQIGRASSLTMEQKDEIFERVERGDSVSALAREYGVSRQSIYNDINWRKKHNSVWGDKE